MGPVTSNPAGNPIVKVAGPWHIHVGGKCPLCWPKGSRNG